MPSIPYSASDFDSLKAAMLAQVPGLAPSWTNMNETDMGVALINLVAGVGDMLSYLLDRRVDEVYLGTAIQRESVKRLCRLIDYELSRPVAAKTTLRFTLPVVATTNLTIPKYTQVKTTDGMFFTTKDTATIFIGQTYVDVDGYQGAYQSDTFTGTGQDTQSFVLSRDHIAQNFLDVVVGNQLWTEDTSDTSPALATVFKASSDDAEIVTLIFTAFLGTVPPQNTPIVANCIATKGAAGNIGSGLVTKIVTAIPGGGQLSVTNRTVASGGKDAETLDEARIKAPRRLRPMGRVVSLSDYQDNLETFPKVAKAQAIDHNGYVEMYVAIENGEVFFVPAPVVALAKAAAATALSAGTYVVAVTATDSYGESSTWEYHPVDKAVIDQKKTLALTAGDKLIVTVTNPIGATGLKVYVSTDGGSSWTLAATATPDVSGTTVVNLTGRGTTTSMPAINTTGVRAENSTGNLRSAAEEYVEERRTIGTVFALFNPVYVPVNVTATVKLFDNYLQLDREGAVETALRDFFAYGKRSFAEAINLSDLYTAIKDVEGVRSVNLDSPTDDVTVSDGQIAVLGTVTLTMAGGVA